MNALPILYSFRRCPYAIRARMALAVAGIAGSNSIPNQAALLSGCVTTHPRATHNPSLDGLRLHSHSARTRHRL